jgi:hypothetical protein
VLYDLKQKIESRAKIVGIPIITVDP